MERIHEGDFTILKTLYKTDHVEVFKAAITKTNKLIAVKKLLVSSLDELNNIYKEAIAMAKLKHPNIVNLRSCIIGGKGLDPEYILFIMDYYPCGDLSREIHKRIPNNTFWSEFELLELMKSLINAYKFLQENDVAHRDIKPNNIFVTEDNTLKIADLGSVSNRKGLIKPVSMNLTITGTKSYLSPILWTAYIQICKGIIETRKVRHNPFKSDVYSLGLTFLYMASLQKVIRSEEIVNNIEKNIGIMINQLNYSQNLKNILFQMLAYEEESRPNFIELDRAFMDLFFIQPAIEQQINNKIEEERKDSRIKVKDFNVRNLLSNRKIVCKVCTRKKAVNLISASIKAIIDSDSFGCLAERLYILNVVHCKITIGKLSYICGICKGNNCEYITTCCSILTHQACYIGSCERTNKSRAENRGLKCCFCQKYNRSDRENFHSFDYTRYISINPQYAPLYQTAKAQEVSISENDNEQSQEKLNFSEKRQNSSPNLEILTSLCFICRRGNVTVVSFSCGHKFCKECFCAKINKCRKEICFSCPKEYNFEELLIILQKLKWNVNSS
ncbi:unnamed protein product [Blepharisma stoltei]|uniref:Protein kinase domain-containing protein n=1 Tax=Blepharisma stoltei TaxID=1481888 RepID=A0AAU9K4B7_9CILI|nr:unnamed protein product [Blepharisma stoltei]